MAVKAINTALTTSAQNRLGKNQENKNQNSNPSFQGSNPVVMLMDAIDRGGFAASFIAQDGIGMVAPRIKEGLNRGREKDENGKRTGPLNWEFARKEGVREILSGPSAFIIPAGILAVIKKYSGTANNVSMDMIKGLGGNFEKYAAGNKNTLSDVAKTKREFYEEIFKNVLSTSTEGKLSTEEIGTLAKKYTEKVIEIEGAKPKNALKHLLGKPVANSKQDLAQALTDEFMLLRKQYVSPSANEIIASIAVEGKEKPVSLSFKKLLDNMKDFTDDAINSVNKQLKKDAGTNVTEYLQKFTSRRLGSRFVTNMSMFLAVVSFYTIIPKLYNLGLKGNPALKNTENANSQNPAGATEKAENNPVEKSAQQAKDPSFQGREKFFSKTGDTVMNSGWLKKLSDKFEFNGPSMSVPAMLTLLFGFCLPPRYIQAQDKYDKAEIAVRDISSFAAILFAAKAMARGFSDGFAKLSGLALNTKPEDHDKSFWHKLKNYFTPASGVNVLSSEEIISKYTNIDKYPGGINGFFEFLEKNGGNIKKTLMLDKEVKANAEKILGKNLKDATIDEIKAAFSTVKDGDALENIYKVFRNKGNKFISYAKTMNSSFGFLSTLVLVPAFMIWLARTCERMTKNKIEKEKALHPQTTETGVQPAAAQSQTTAAQHITTNKPSMEGFLTK